MIELYKIHAAQNGWIVMSAESASPWVFTEWDDLLNWLKIRYYGVDNGKKGQD
jgi:hypothetical protein